jgi:hypothetical protein
VIAIDLPADVEARIKQKLERGDVADAGEVVMEDLAAILEHIVHEAAQRSSVPPVARRRTVAL